MTNYVPLSKTHHSQAGIRPSGFGFASRQAAVPLVAEDVPRVLALMVMAFVVKPDGKRFELAALQSLEPGKNLYVHTNGRWITGYQPAWYRSHPFRLLPDETGQRQVLCVDEESDAFVTVASPDDKALFDENGEQTELTRNLVTFLTQVEQSRRATQARVDELQQAGVLVPWTISMRNPEGEAGRDIGGVYHVDEKALRSLDDKILARLTRSGALSMAYAQLFSEHRLPILSKLYNLRNEALLRDHDVDVSELFGEGDDEFSFDFDS